MSSCSDDYDEELHDDPIKLCFNTHHSNSCCYLGSSMNKEVGNMPCKLQIETIDLTGTSYSGDIKVPKPLSIKDDVCYQIKQLAIEIVDFRKFPWYYKKCIKYYNNAESREVTNGIVVCEDQNNTNVKCMKIKYDTDKGQWKVQDRKPNASTHIKDRFIPETKFRKRINKIDFKRNEGLVGLTIIPKFVTEDIIVKIEKETSSVELDCEDDTFIEQPVDINIWSNKDTEVTKEHSIKDESYKIIEKFPKNSSESNRPQPLALIKKTSNYITSLKSSPQKETHFLVKLENIEPCPKLVNDRLSTEKPSESLNTSKNQVPDRDCLPMRDTETDGRFKRKNYKKKRNLLVNIKVRESKNKVDKKEQKKPINSPVVTKKDTIKVRKDIFKEVESVSEREVPVINSSSKQYQNIKNFVDKATKMAKHNKLNSTNTEGTKCYKPKPLDMPILTEECEKTLAEPSDRRPSFKDSIVFENDDVSTESYGKIRIEKVYTLSSIQQTLEKESSDVQKSLQINNSNLCVRSVAENVTTTSTPAITDRPINTHTIPVVSYTNTGTSKPRIKYTPMNKDCAIPMSHNVTTNHGMSVGPLHQTPLPYPSPVNGARQNAQNQHLIQLLGAQQNSQSIGAVSPIQHRLPQQPMPQYSAPQPPPPYPPNYACWPGYTTAVNSKSAAGYRTYRNNSDVNSNLHYMYPGYGASVQPPPQPQVSQWQPNFNYNQNQHLHYQTNLHYPNTSSNSWNNGYSEGINNMVLSSAYIPTNYTAEKQSASFGTHESYPQAEAMGVAKLPKKKTRKTCTPKNTTQNNEALEGVNEFVLNSGSAQNTLKRPYDHCAPIEKEVLSSLLEFELSKRPKTTPLVASEDSWKGKPNGYLSPVLAPLVANENSRKDKPSGYLSPVLAPLVANENSRKDKPSGYSSPVLAPLVVNENSWKDKPSSYSPPVLAPLVATGNSRKDKPSGYPSPVLAPLVVNENSWKDKPSGYSPPVLAPLVANENSRKYKPSGHSSPVLAPLVANENSRKDKPSGHSSPVLAPLVANENSRKDKPSGYLPPVLAPLVANENSRKDKPSGYSSPVQAPLVANENSRKDKSSGYSSPVLAPLVANENSRKDKPSGYSSPVLAALVANENSRKNKPSDYSSLILVPSVANENSAKGKPSSDSPPLPAPLVTNENSRKDKPSIDSPPVPAPLVSNENSRKDKPSGYPSPVQEPLVANEKSRKDKPSRDSPPVLEPLVAKEKSRKDKLSRDSPPVLEPLVTKEKSRKDKPRSDSPPVSAPLVVNEKSRKDKTSSDSPPVQVPLVGNEKSRKVKPSRDSPPVLASLVAKEKSSKDKPRSDSALVSAPLVGNEKSRKDKPSRDSPPVLTSLVAKEKSSKDKPTSDSAPVSAPLVANEISRKDKPSIDSPPVPAPLVANEKSRKDKASIDSPPVPAPLVADERSRKDKPIRDSPPVLASLVAKEKSRKDKEGSDSPPVSAPLVANEKSRMDKTSSDSPPVQAPFVSDERSRKDKPSRDPPSVLASLVAKEKSSKDKPRSDSPPVSAPLVANEKSRKDKTSSDSPPVQVPLVANEKSRKDKLSRNSPPVLALLVAKEKARKGKPSGYSPPIIPIPTNSTILSSFFIPSRTSKMTHENVQKDAKATCASRRIPIEPVYKSRKITLEDYKRRIRRNDSTDSSSSADRSAGNTKGTEHEPNSTAKKFKTSNYYLEQDLGYSSDTTIKL